MRDGFTNPDSPTARGALLAFAFLGARDGNDVREAPEPSSTKSPRSERARRFAVPLLVAALLAFALPGPGMPQDRSASEWPEEMARIRELLDGAKWKQAGKRAERLGVEIEGNAWEQTEIADTLARLGRYKAVIEINLGLERQALWHWLSAANFARPDDLDWIASLGNTGVLIETELRRLGEMPAGYRPIGDLERLRLEAPVVPEVERPVLANTVASRDGRIPDLIVEVLIDREGWLLHPVIDDTGVPPVAAWATLDWLLTYPAAQPATLDGTAVDVLQPLIIDFGRDRKPGAIFWQN